MFPSKFPEQLDTSEGQEDEERDFRKGKEKNIFN
jgi:hypothetical protein